MSNINFTQSDIDYILSPKAVRDRANKIFDLCLNGKTHFQYNDEQFDYTLKYVTQTIKKNYPDLVIPFHSRWGHFRVGEIDREKEFNSLIEEDRIERCRSKIDLVITSVLLDAGAGNTWKYLEQNSNKEFNRSEGLAVASYHMFLNGDFSSTDNKLQADGKGLEKLSSTMLENGFQVSESNPLVGVDGRVNLLNSLGKVVQKKSEYFKDQRPGNLIDYVLENHGMNIEASDLLKIVLLSLGDIWPGRISLGDTNLGDVWQHSQLGASNSVDSLVPFHKLSQWLTYSLMEPMMEAGIKITNLNGMTGLPEYRNGGLLIDTGLISLRDPSDIDKGHGPESELIIEWRALTIVMLDKLGAAIREELKMSEEEFPLVKALEGGTWWAGRYIAREKREGGTPPLNIISDGTVF